MKIEQINDYALPCMNAENALKEAHNFMLGRGYDEAIDECTKAVTNITNMMAAIKEMKAKDK
jgi:hypothetical protein